MSDPRAQGPFSAIVTPIAEGIAKHQTLPAYEKNLNRASGGAGILAWCAYLAATLGNNAAGLPPAARLVWLGAAAFGLLWLCVGVRGGRGPRDVMGAFWSAAGVGLCTWLLWIGAYPADWGPLAAFLLTGCYLGGLASGAVRFWLAVRGMPVQQLPDPATLPDLPMSGPASRDEAHDAMFGRGREPPPRFPT